MAKKATRKAAKTTARKAPARKVAKPVKRPAKAARSHTPTRGLYGWITHTDLSSRDPAATKAWAAKVLGWQFRPSFPMPDGSEYHLFAYSDKGGGGIRPLDPGEAPGSLPYVHVADTDAAFAKALREGAEEVLAPNTVMPGVRLAIVRAPGGVPIGFSGPSEPA